MEEDLYPKDEGNVSLRFKVLMLLQKLAVEIAVEWFRPGEKYRARF